MVSPSPMIGRCVTQPSPAGTKATPRECAGNALGRMPPRPIGGIGISSYRTIVCRSDTSHTRATEHEVLHGSTAVRPRSRRYGRLPRGRLGRRRPRSARSRRPDRDELRECRPYPSHARRDHPHLRARDGSSPRVRAVPALASTESPSFSSSSVPVVAFRVGIGQERNEGAIRPFKLRPKEPEASVVRWLIPAVVAAMLSGLWWRRRRSVDRQRRLMLLCRRAGLEFAPLDLSPDTAWLPFPMFGHPRHGTENVVWERGEDVRAFDFWYHDTGDERALGSRRRFTCAVVPLGFTCPRLRVAPRDVVDDIVGALGGREVRLELEEFDRRFRVEAEDARVAGAVL